VVIEEADIMGENAKLELVDRALRHRRTRRDGQ
jgi:hypothetical protein